MHLLMLVTANKISLFKELAWYLILFYGFHCLKKWPWRRRSVQSLDLKLLYYNKLIINARLYY